MQPIKSPIAEKFETALAQPPAKETALQQTQETGKTETKPEIIEFKALNYTELIPVLNKGMQELDQENTQLKSELQELKPLVNQDMETPFGCFSQQIHIRPKLS
jgi:hypothetical protein